MHIILAFLGAVVTILILVNRLSDAGIDLGWLNPFAWRRRRAWRNKYEGNPVFSLNEPLEIAALLATAVAKLDGDISREEQQQLLALFQQEFNRSEQEASDLLRSSIFLFGDGEDVLAKPEKILAHAIDRFSIEQADSMLDLISVMAQTDVANSEQKLAYKQRIQKVCDEHFRPEKKW
jgi:uncharacterized tellurite resistance protein B-like protein